MTALALSLPLTAPALDDIMHSEGRTAILKGGSTEDPTDRKPGPNQLICYYTTGSIAINFPAEIDHLTISIGEPTAPVWTGEVTATDPVATFPAISGERLVTCTTDEGSLYSGYLSF